MAFNIPIRAIGSEPTNGVKEALADQQDLSAVDRFARQHESGTIPHQEKFYRELIPLSKPKTGEQYAFEVDMDACTGCKACVSACHNLNGLDATETWRSVGLLLGGSAENPFQKTVTTACHHCVEPACLSGCPTKAYTKDPQTGIVKHLDDQCIGCKYCTLMCPYEVPQYNARLGIVRKCDMCQSRLSVGQAPACVQACPNQAIRIKIVNQAEVLRHAESGSFLPGAPKPEMTAPSTDYKTQSAFPRNLLPADYYSIKPSHSHLPLVVMLVLTQLSVGAFVVQWGLNRVLLRQDLLALAPFFSVLAFLLGQAALGASLFHLGRPWIAFRAVLGLRTSWLSREILAFTLFSAAASLYAASFWLNHFAGYFGLVLPEVFLKPDLLLWLESAVAFLGVAAIGTSVMVYRATLRPAWDNWTTAVKFYLTAWICGSAFLLCVAFLLNLFSPDLFNLGPMAKLLAKFILIGSALKLTLECLFLRHLQDRRLNPFKRSALLLMGSLNKIFRARLICGLLGGLFAPLIMMYVHGSAPFLCMVAMVLFLAVTAGEWLERYLFFTAESADRMPGAFV